MSNNILRAFWVSAQEGVLFLKNDWKQNERGLPPVKFTEDGMPSHLQVNRIDPFLFAKNSGYFSERNLLIFIMLPNLVPLEESGTSKFFLAGTFNHWTPDVKSKEWLLTPELVCGELCWVIRMNPNKIPDLSQFKFVSENGYWTSLPPDCQNIARCENGITNFQYNASQTGYHCFSFYRKCDDFDFNKNLQIRFGNDQSPTNIDHSGLLANKKSDKKLGAQVSNHSTHFALFAPRATKVTLVLTDTLHSEPNMIPMTKDCDGLWEYSVKKNLSGKYYNYILTDKSGNESIVIDPYAIAMVSKHGPGIIVDTPKHVSQENDFKPPQWSELIICEAHIRDILTNYRYEMSDQDRLGFSGLCKILADENNYFKNLGINAVELQPIQEFDNNTKEEYHWGYMPVNYFSPSSAYALHPTTGSQISEFKNLVNSFHRNNIAVILDVVYNHVGEPNYLARIDKEYYFRINGGNFENYSGCGNDLRTETPMSTRLILDSLCHFIQMYDVDGFRFDLAELLGLEFLKKAENTLKKIKKSVILIAEPWSFRGHIGNEIRSTGFSAWNDEYRNFAADYILGNGNREGLEYFIGGSLRYRSSFPAQTVNYVSSHDDRSWMDRITENPNNDGKTPTVIDRRRTNLSIALLLSSIGIPMFAAGHDILHSKSGVQNTYKRGDLNALSYGRGAEYSATHKYMSDYIKLRKSQLGKLLRPEKRPSKNYLRAFGPIENNSAIAILFNANHELGNEQLLFAINPHFSPATFDLAEINFKNFIQLADTECVNMNGLHDAFHLSDNDLLSIPMVSCGLWLKNQY
ncbi:MAG: hypothetical protein LBH49_02340 [Puniceicoccales bacterium]|jgi:pullulanase/glycogen debranching enzyme|nr:hypothetical protein [Puniceicoccales bacterium]